MPLNDPQSILILVVFVGVILAIAFDWIDMLLAALLGVCTLTSFGIYHRDDVISAIGAGQEPLALLFGGMVVARTLEPTGIFENIGTRFLILTRGSGRRYLLGIVALVAPICAFLPNATTVILVAPITIRTAIALEADFVGPMILTAIISNHDPGDAGLLPEALHHLGDQAAVVLHHLMLERRAHEFALGKGRAPLAGDERRKWWTE